MKKVRSTSVHFAVYEGVCMIQKNAKKIHGRGLVLLVCAFAVVLNGVCPSGAFATECEGGHWELVETIRDQWGYPDPQSTFISYGITMGFWEQPTSCADVAYEGENKLEYVKTLVCVSSALTKIQEAPESPNCVIEG
jgi:hypothetical protein